MGTVFLATQRTTRLRDTYFVDKFLKGYHLTLPNGCKIAIIETTPSTTITWEIEKGIGTITRWFPFIQGISRGVSKKSEPCTNSKTSPHLMVSRET